MRHGWADAGETHPRRERLSSSALAALPKDRDPAVRRLYLDTHALVLETLPDVRWSTDMTDGMTGYALHQYGYSGWGMAALSAHTHWVSLGFLRGADLPDPAKLLEGTGKRVRHVKIRSADQLDAHRGALRELIAAAARLNS